MCGYSWTQAACSQAQDGIDGKLDGRGDNRVVVCRQRDTVMGPFHVNVQRDAVGGGIRCRGGGWRRTGVVEMPWSSPASSYIGVFLLTTITFDCTFFIIIDVVVINIANFHFFLIFFVVVFSVVRWAFCGEVSTVLSVILRRSRGSADTEIQRSERRC
jgi:hypothetical protein